MAVTVSKGPVRNVPGGAYRSRAELTLDTSYPNTGATVGYPLTPAMFGFVNRIDDVRVLDQVTDTGYACAIDHTSGKLRVFQSAGSLAAMTEIANGVDLSAVIVRLEAYGR